jgi:periplasmic protein CpxP/Spy
MKTLTRSLMFAALVSTTALVQAQAPAPAGAAEPGKPQMRGMHMSPEQHTARMKQELELSEEQTSAVAELNQRYFARFGELREQSQAQREDRHAGKRALMGERDAELRQILSEEQYARLEARREEHRSMRRQHKEHRRAATPPPGA